MAGSVWRSGTFISSIFLRQAEVNQAMHEESESTEKHRASARLCVLQSRSQKKLCKVNKFDYVGLRSGGYRLLPRAKRDTQYRTVYRTPNTRQAITRSRSLVPRPRALGLGARATVRVSEAIVVPHPSQRPHGALLLGQAFFLTAPSVETSQVGVRIVHRLAPPLGVATASGSEDRL